MSKKVMIADDDEGILDSMKMMLEMEGYEVTTTPDGQQVLEMKQELPDLLLLDVWMSGIDGRDVCRYLKGQADTRHIPVIMVSASRDISHSVRDAGADDFIAKPFEMDELLEKVGKYLMQDFEKGLSK